MWGFPEALSPCLDDDVVARRFDCMLACALTTREGRRADVGNGEDDAHAMPAATYERPCLVVAVGRFHVRRCLVAWLSRRVGRVPRACRPSER